MGRLQWASKLNYHTAQTLFKEMATDDLIQMTKKGRITKIYITAKGIEFYNKYFHN